MTRLLLLSCWLEDDGFEVTQRKLQPAEVGMIVVADGKGDIDGIARQ